MSEPAPRHAESRAEMRSRIMAAVPSRDTKPEMLLRRAIHARGLRYRVHASEMPGRPDVCFAKWRAVLMVHGCFWHRHESCRKATTPRSNISFWSEKFRRNIERDRHNVDLLIGAGWRVGIVWECWIGNALDEAKITELVAFVRDKEITRAEWPLRVLSELRGGRTTR